MKLSTWATLGILLAVLGPISKVEGQLASFDLTTGVIAVDYASYLAHHDLVYKNESTLADPQDGNPLITGPQNGTPLATGRVGSLIWSVTGGLSMQITNVDASPQSSISQGTATFKTTPELDSAYSAFEQRLSLYDGIVTTTYAPLGSSTPDRRITFFGDVKSQSRPLQNELLGIHVEDSRSNVTQATFELRIWDPSHIQNYGFHGPGVPDFSNPVGFFHVFLSNPAEWQTVTPKQNIHIPIVGLQRGTHDQDGFGYTLAASVQGAGADVSVSIPPADQDGGQTVRITMIHPTKSYTIWIACVSRKNSTSGDTWQDAQNLISNAKREGYATVLRHFRDSWRTYWSKSFVRYRDGGGDADFLETLYYLSQYLIAGGSQATFPMHFTSTPYRFESKDPLSDWVTCPTDDDPARMCERNYWWSGAYVHFNQRNLNNWMLTSNHADLMDPYLNLYGGTINGINQRAKLESNTISRSEGGYTCPGMPAGSACLMVPEYTRFNGSHAVNQGGLNRRELSTSIEVAENMYLRYLYNPQGIESDAQPQATSFLETKAYPFMRGVANFFTYASDDNGFVLAWDANDSNCKDGGTQHRPSGCYHVNKSSALENFPNIGDDAPTLAGLKVLLPWVIREGSARGDDTGGNNTTDWQERLRHLVNLPIFTLGSSPFYVPFRGYDPNDNPSAGAYDPGKNPYGSNNWQNPEMEIIYPHGAVGSADPEIQQAWGKRHHPYYYMFIWHQDAIDAARLRRGDASLTALTSMVERYFQSSRNGQSLDGIPIVLANGSIERGFQNGRMEPNGIVIATINEQLLGYDYGADAGSVIEVFPALPSGIDTAAFTLAARGGFLVSSQYDKGLHGSKGTIRYVGVKSQYGGTFALRNPWCERACLKRSNGGILGGTCVAQVDANEVVNETTLAGDIFVLERSDSGKAFGDYTSSRERRYYVPNQSSKMLADGQVVLGDNASPSLPSNEMIVWNYDFDEGTGCRVNDHGDVGGAGTIVGHCQFVSLDNGGHALSLDGASFVEVPHNPKAESRITTQLVVDLWVNPLGASGFRRLVDKETPGTADGWLVDLTGSNQVRFITSSAIAGATNPTMIIATTDNPIPNGKWSHVRAVFDSAASPPVMAILVDGVAQDTTITGELSPNLILASNDNPLRIGGDNATPVGELFDGQIDDILILNRTTSLDSDQSRRTRLDSGQSYMGDNRPAMTLLRYSMANEPNAAKYSDDASLFNYSATLLGGAAISNSQGISVGRGGLGWVEIPTGETGFDLVKDQLSIDVSVFPRVAHGSGRQRILDRSRSVSGSDTTWFLLGSNRRGRYQRPGRIQERHDVQFCESIAMESYPSAIYLDLPSCRVAGYDYEINL